MATKTLSAVEEAHGMDTTTPFFKSLPDIVENVSNPLSALGTAYKQQVYVSNNFPYVVSSDDHEYSERCSVTCCYVTKAYF